MNARHGAIVVGKAVVAAAVTWILVFPFLLALPLPLALVVGVVVWLALTLAPWRRFWRSGWSRSRKRGRPTRIRLVTGAATAICGAAVCVASDYWFATHAAGFREAPPVSNVPFDLLISAPFWLVATLIVLSGMSGVAACASALALAALTVSSYDAAYNGGTSTSALALLVPWEVGFPGLLFVYLLDAAVRGAAAWWRDRGRSGPQAREM